MEEQRVIVIGASAGGIEALRELFKGLKPGLNAAIFIVVHMPSDAKSYLPDILSRLGTIPVEHAQDEKKIKAGRAYIAPPDRHLILQDGSIRLSFGPKVNYSRPAVDPLFESAAKNFGPRVIGVILSGSLYDGTKGLMSIKRAGGTAMVQDPKEALFPGMPESALHYVQVDYNLPVAEIASLLNKLTEESVLEKGGTQVSQEIPDFIEGEADLIKKDMEAYEKGYGSNQRTILTCPECGGVLWELRDGQLLRYRCHTGHVYNAENILAGYDEDLEKTFWTAIRMLTEKAAISNRLGLNAQDRGDKEQEAYYLSLAQEAEIQIQLIRETWLHEGQIGSKHASAGEQADNEVTNANE